MASPPSSLLRNHLALAITLVLTASLSPLTGCGIAKTDAAAPTPNTGGGMSGHVHGGQQPVSGSRVFMFEAGQNGYGGYEVSDLAPAAILANGAAGGGYDTTYGTYVLTDANGNFTITDGYACSEGTPVYLFASGGNPGFADPTTNNSALALMASLGPCPAGGFSSSLYITINEVTTVAAVYALSGFLTEQTSTDPTPPNFSVPPNDGYGFAALTNAAANANQLADITTGAARTSTPNGNGIVPQAEIYTLANIIAACVNTDGTNTDIDDQPTACYKVLNGVEGLSARDTVGLLLNVVATPNETTVKNLSALSTKTSPFQPSLDGQPNDFTIAIVFAGGGLDSPGIPGIDQLGNVWFPNTNLTVHTINGPQAYIIEMSPQGDFLTSKVGLPLLVSAIPTQVAVDIQGNPWLAFSSGGFVAKVTVVNSHDTTRSLHAVSTTSEANNDDVHQIAFDSSGNLYISDYSDSTIYQLDITGAPVSTFNPIGNTFQGVALLTDDIILTYGTVGAHAAEFNDTGHGIGGSRCGTGAACGLSSPYAFAVNSSGDVWATNGDGQLVAFDPQASFPQTGSPFSTGLSFGPGPAEPTVWLAIDGGQNVWVPNYNNTTIAEYSSTGTYLSPALHHGYMSGLTTCAPQGLAIDSSGDVWVSCDSSTAPVLEFIGTAVPTYTPLTPGYFGLKP